MPGGVIRPVRGVILAGGGATRLGGIPKGLEPVGGARILDRVAAALREALGTEPLLIANDPAAGTWGFEVAADRHPGAGPLGGIATGLAVTGGPVLCTAWDMPFLPPGLLRRIAGALTGADVVLPESDGPRGIEPLAAGYGPEALGPIREAIARGDLAAVAFHGAVRITRIPLAEVRGFGDPARVFLNVNTPDDLARARAWADSPSPGLPG